MALLSAGLECSVEEEQFNFKNLSSYTMSNFLLTLTQQLKICSDMIETMDLQTVDGLVRLMKLFVLLDSQFDVQYKKNMQGHSEEPSWTSKMLMMLKPLFKIDNVDPKLSSIKNLLL